MSIFALIAVGVLIFLHLYFMILEMFLWTKPLGLKVFKMSIEDAKSKHILAANQGLYNGFLAAGLSWSLLYPEPLIGKQLAMFFSGCIFVAGIYGGYSASKAIYFIQGLPGLITIVLLFLS